MNKKVNIVKLKLEYLETVLMLTDEQLELLEYLFEDNWMEDIEYIKVNADNIIDLTEV